MNIFVTNVWVIPLLPLAVFILNIFVIRPLDVANRDKGLAHADQSAHDVHDLAGAHGDPEQHDTHAPVDIPALLEESYVPAIDTIDGHVDTPAALSRSRRTAQKTHGGREFIRLMDRLETEPHHPHGAPTFYARLAGFLGIAGMLAAFAWSVAILFALLGDPSLQRGVTVHLYDWLVAGNLKYSINFYVDSLTAIMLCVVTGISTLVQFYSQEYIEGDEPRGYARFFAWLSIFSLSMLLLVLSANFLLIYIGWELVGLSSYLLIGFQAGDSPKPLAGRPSPGSAAMKAFVTNRVGDFGFLIGILILFTQTGTFVFRDIPANLHADKGLLTVAMLLIFCGAVGKSAQFPLHVWLPDAMEGPTPVSALIHAATMVAAGVYLIARTLPLFQQFAGPEALTVVAYIGGFTAIFAAAIALVQTDIKRVLAYSTISQLGYMFVGLGVQQASGTAGPGIFHLMTHAFFKALLFLGSGAVLHALAGQQDMRKMGGLAPKLRLIAIPFLLANLAISGIPPFSGFFSKDEIIAQAFEHGYYVLWAAAVITSLLTAFYMFRLWFLTFGGKGGSFGGWWGGEYRGDAHVHAPGIRLWLPLWILAVPTLFSGFLGWSAVGGNFNAFITGNPAAEAFKNPFTDWLTIPSLLAGVLGITLAWAMYGVRVIPVDVFTRNPLGRGLYTVFANKFYVDEVYLAFIRFGVMGVSRVAVGFDRYIIDGIINGTGASVIAFGRGLRRAESGRLQNYGAAMFGGALLIAATLFAVVYFNK